MEDEGKDMDFASRYSKFSWGTALVTRTTKILEGLVKFLDY
jgi:hypothetical protein